MALRSDRVFLRITSVSVATFGLVAYVLFGALPTLALVPEATLLVSLRGGASTQAAEELIGASGGVVLERLRPLAVYRVRVPREIAAEELLERLLAQPRLVRAAELEGEQVAELAPNDSLYVPFQWNLRRIGMEKAWDLRPSAADVIVGVLDTGVDLNHPDLRPNLLLDLGYNALDETPTPQDDESHGTAVAGIIGAVGNNREGVTGIAWRVKVLPIKALNAQGRGPD
ncbi:MAG: S8 family serine peptidase, partial [Chloroflexota bacterium]|nr:S8 family serine peptidase [Chloroflexota bacterium]